MAINSQKYMIQNMERLSFFDLATGACDFVADDLQNAEMVNEQETVYGTGKNGVKIGSADRAKASRITATNGAIVDGVLAAQTGSAVEVGEHIAPWVDAIVTKDGQAATTTYKAVGTIGNEIQWIYIKNTDGTLGAKFAQGATATDKEFSYSPDDKEIQLPSGAFTSGQEIVCFYNIKVKNAKKITNAENKFSKTGRLVADIFAKDVCTEKSYYGKIIYPKAKCSGAFNLNFGNEMSVQSLAFEAMSGGCGGNNSKALWDLIIFDDEDAE